MGDLISREIRLKSRPEGVPEENDFELAEIRVPEIQDGQVLIRNIFMSVDPYMRGRMTDRPSYVPPFRIGRPLEGAAVGRVKASKHPEYAVGDAVQNFSGWREYVVSDGAGLTRVDAEKAPIQAYLGVLGMTGMTAYVGLLDIGNPQKEETVFVSAASGAVGSVACQIAKLKGCRVVGSAGSDDKVSWLLETAGIDAAFNYKRADDLAETLRKSAPGGIDVYYENVGGAHLEAAIENMNVCGRIAMCGMISQYNEENPVAGPANLSYVIGKRLRMQGFIVSDHMDKMPRFVADMTRWIAEGRIKWKETVWEGIEKAPAAFIGLFKGENFGKMLVKIGEMSHG